ncbi:MAG TPA: IS110 family transposase [Aggregatilineaceae bacterium]|jgi:transposase|nr:IS110 family transposase [Aggregatilineaceae bacterium]
MKEDKNMSTLIAGIDIGGSNNDVCAVSDTGEVIAAHQRFAHTRPGSEELAGWLVEQVTQGEFDRLQIAGESTGLHWFHLFWHLQHTAEFDDLDVELYLVNAHAVAKFKPSLGEQEKTDVKDAYAIAEWLRFRQRPHHQLYLDARFLPLQRLTRHRFHLMHNLAREKVYARQVALYLKMSTYQPQQPFSDPFAKSGWWVLLAHATLDEIAQRNLDELTADLRLASDNHLPDPRATAEQLQQLAQIAYPLPPGLAEAVNLMLAQLQAHITFLQQQLVTLDQQIEALAQTLPGYAHLASIPGIGPVYAAGLLAEIQDVQRFMTDHLGRPRPLHQGQAALAKFAGLWWPRHESSDFKADNRRLAKTGNRYLRYYLVEAANSVRLKLPDYRAFYQRKSREAVRYHHRRALVLTARKLARLVFSLLLNDRPYQLRGGDPAT